MFQVEPILWLQAHTPAPLGWLLSTVTLLGYAPTYVALVLALAFGFRLRAGLGVLLALVLCSTLTEGLKEGLALPRPGDVDLRVAAPGFVPVGSRAASLARGGASSFWSLPPPDAIAAARSRRDGSHGFPSGHVAAALAFVLATALFCRWPAFAAAGLVWPALMALSRMYLGRHFLADVLGGLALGSAAVGLAALLLRRSGLSSGLAALLVALLPFVPLLDPDSVGRLAGAVAALALLLKQGLPRDDGTLAQRCARVLLAAGILVVLWWAGAVLLRRLGLEDARLANAAAAAVALSAAFTGGVAIARRVGWYQPDATQRATRP